jgi:hypothetical protein
MTNLLYFEHRDEDFARLASGTCPQSVCLSVCLSVWCRHVAILNRPEWHLVIWSLVLLRTCHVLETATNRASLWARLVCRPHLVNSGFLKRVGGFQYEERCFWRRVVTAELCVPAHRALVREFVCVSGWLRYVYSYLRFKFLTTASSSESCRRFNSCSTGESLLFYTTYI